MWQNFLSLDDSGTCIVAKLSDDVKLTQRLTKSGVNEVIADLNADTYYLDSEQLDQFITWANEKNHKALEGVIVAEIKNAELSIEISEDKMLAHMIVTGAYGGRGLRGSEIVHALAESHVTKGINKLALKKVLQISNSLEAGKEYTQAVAVGKKTVPGRDGRLKPLIPDVTKQVLAPQAEGNSTKVDMRNLGDTVSVEVNQPVLKREPPTQGNAGYTVHGDALDLLPGKDVTLKVGKGTEIDANDSNLLIATETGMPLIKDGTVHIENALCMENISVKTGHVKFKGSLVVTGNIEADMVVRATGNILVGGFIESADVQAQGDIFVKKGIIGHTVSEGDPKTCTVKSGGSIKANYAQYSLLQSHHHIHLAMHSLSNDLSCGEDLTVLDSRIQHGTLSGGHTKVGGKVICYNLGVEGDTPTSVECFACYSSMKARIETLREQYLLAQDKTMKLVRRELDFKKKPKSERSDNEEQEIEELKESANEAMIVAKNVLDVSNSDLEESLERNTIEVKHQVYTHVTLQFGNEQIITKNEHGASLFSFNQYEISCKSALLDSDIKGDL
ncbi:DUF342 domain-containing protein [Vibrio sp. WJH972]